jgi:hypothetical protein
MIASDRQMTRGPHRSQSLPCQLLSYLVAVETVASER